MVEALVGNDLGTDANGHNGIGDAGGGIEAAMGSLNVPLNIPMMPTPGRDNGPPFHGILRAEGASTPAPSLESMQQQLSYNSYMPLVLDLLLRHQAPMLHMGGAGGLRPCSSPTPPHMAPSYAHLPMVQLPPFPPATEQHQHQPIHPTPIRPGATKSVVGIGSTTTNVVGLETRPVDHSPSPCDAPMDGGERPSPGDAGVDNHIVCDRTSFSREINNMLHFGMNVCVAAGLPPGEGIESVKMFHLQRQRSRPSGNSSRAAMQSSSAADASTDENTKDIGHIMLGWSMKKLRSPKRQKKGGSGGVTKKALGEIRQLLDDLKQIAAIVDDHNEERIIEIERRATQIMRDIQESSLNDFKGFIEPIKVKDRKANSSAPSTRAPTPVQNAPGSAFASTLPAVPIVTETETEAKKMEGTANRDSEEACAAPPRIDGDATDPPPRDAIAGGAAQRADGGAGDEPDEVPPLEADHLPQSVEHKQLILHKKHRDAITEMSLSRAKVWAREKLDLVFASFVESLGNVRDEFHKCLSERYILGAAASAALGASMVVSPLQTLLPTQIVLNQPVGKVGQHQQQQAQEQQGRGVQLKKTGKRARDSKPIKSKIAPAGEQDARGAPANYGKDAKKQPMRRHRANLSRDAIVVLKEWMHQHFVHPYPDDRQKQTLIDTCGVNLAQLNNWFINTRVRYWKPKVEKIFDDNKAILERAADQEGSGVLQKKMEEAAMLRNSQTNSGSNSSASAMMYLLMAVPEVAKVVTEFSARELEKIQREIAKREREREK